MSSAFRPSFAKTTTNSGSGTRSAELPNRILSSSDLQSNLQPINNNTQAKQHHQLSEPSISSTIFLVPNNLSRVKVQSPLYNTWNIQNNLNAVSTTAVSSATTSAASGQQIDEVCVFEMLTCYQKKTYD